MAPKGGGRGGGSSGSSSSDSGSSSSSSGSSSSYGGSSRSGSSYYSRSSNPWLRKTSLPGTNWTVDVAVALVVFAGLFLITLIGIRIYAGRAKKKHWNSEIWKAVMGKRWGVAIWLGLLYYCWQFIERILHEATVAVANSYLIVEFILLSFGLIAEIFLLLVIYTLLHRAFLHPMGTSDSKAKTKRTIFLGHVAICGLLGVLYLAYLALGIKRTVELVQDYGSASLARLSSRRSGVLDQFKVYGAYQAIYFVASIEVAAASFFLMLTASKRGFSFMVGVLLVGLIGFPLFLRKVLDLAYAARYLLDSHFPSHATVGATDFITGACHMIIYAGVIVVVGKLAGSGNTQTGQTDANAHPTPQAPPMMTQPGAQPQGQPQFYPQQQYPQQQYANPQQYGQEIKAFNGTSPPPQGHYPAPPQQNGYQPNGFVPQQQYSPPPQQGLAPQAQPMQAPSPVSSQSPPQVHPQPAAQTNPTQQQGAELPSTHY